jgi:hypothetical protein
MISASIDQPLIIV